MGATAKLHRIRRLVAILVVAHGDDAHLIAILLTEERERAGVHRLLRAHQPGDQRRVLSDQPIDLRLDVVERVRPDGAGMAYVEPQPVGRDQRALLRDVIAEGAAERRVKQVRGRVVGPKRRAS